MKKKNFVMKKTELLNKQPTYLIKIFLKLHNHLNKLLHRIERTKMTFPVEKMCYLKSYIPQMVRMTL